MRIFGPRSSSQPGDHLFARPLPLRNALRSDRQVMAGKRFERRLAAILAADVSGYSRLMGRDEEGTLARLMAPALGAG